MDQRGTRRVEIGGLKDKREITAVFVALFKVIFFQCSSFLKEQQNVVVLVFKFPPGWHVTHSKNHWSTEKTVLKYVDNKIVPFIYANRESNDQSALVIMDNLKGRWHHLLLAC